MTIFIVGLALFVVGTLLNAIGWSVHRRSVAESPKGYLEWLLEVFRTWFSKLTGQESTPGERLAAFGAIISAVGLVTCIFGLVNWAK
jgi:hypothetical protein